MRPIAACAMVVVVRTRVSQVTPESPGTPRAMVYGLYRALPGDRLSCHRRPRKLPFANLTPASGRQDHTTSPSASSALVFSTITVHRILPRVRDDLEPPLWGTGPDRNTPASTKPSSEISEIQKFSRGRSDGRTPELPVGRNQPAWPAGRRGALSGWRMRRVPARAASRWPGWRRPE